MSLKLLPPGRHPRARWYPRSLTPAVGEVHLALVLVVPVDVKMRSIPLLPEPPIEAVVAALTVPLEAEAAVDPLSPQAQCPHHVEVPHPRGMVKHP